MAGVETAAAFGDAPAGLATRWKAEVEAFEKEREAWRTRVQGIEERYRDARDDDDEARRFSLLWANVEVLLPTLYAREPKPEVSRRFKDRDPVARVAAQLLERNLAVLVERAGAFGNTMGCAVLDFLLGGQGTGWVRYDVQFGTTPTIEAVEPAAEEAGEVQGDDDAEAPGVPVATAESVLFDYIHWQDFGMTAGARVWEEVGEVWRKSYMTRDALVKRFGDDVGNRVPLDLKRDGDSDADGGTFGKATVYEIWCSTDRKVRWLHKGMDTLLDERPYPLKISGRFPCPKPLFGTMTNENMVPVPDYVQYQDQAKELDDLTGRIAALTKALRLVGMSPGDVAPDLQKVLDSDGEGKIVPVPSWSAYGGAKLSDVIVWLPINEVVQVLSGLHDLRAKVKADAYEITGLSDILRGSTDASETATAQRLKAQWGGVRVRTRQGQVAKFAREALGIMAEVLVGHFDAARIAETAGAQFMSPQDQAFLPAALALLQGDQALLSYRVDVETDSTIETDQDADKQAWSEMLTAIAAFMGAMMPVVETVAKQAPAAAPAMAAMVGELLTGGVRRFNAGPMVEASIEAAFEALGQAAAEPPQMPGAQPPPPDPVAAAKVQVHGMQVQAERERTQADVALAQMDGQHRQADRQLEAARLQLEGAKAQHAMAQPSAVPVQGGMA